jgi:drug/metabolite transporter (DMT)-like permease
VRPGKRVDVALLAVAVVWGSSYLAAKSATAMTPVLVVLWLRYAIAAIVTMALALMRSRLTREEWAFGGLLGVTLAAVLALETFGVAHTSAANAGLIISLTIVLTGALDGVITGRRLPDSFFAAAAVCVLGVSLLVSVNGVPAVHVGDVLMLAAAVVRAGHVVLVGRATRGRPLRALPLTAVQQLTGTLIFGLAASGQTGSVASMDAGTWASVAYLALFCSVFAFLVQTWAIQQTSATRASLLLGTEPIWAVVTSVCVAHEQLGVMGWVGAGLLVAGAYWGQSAERRHREARSPEASSPLAVAAHVHEPAVVTLEGDRDDAGGPVALLGDDEVGFTGPRRLGLVHVFAVKQHDEVGVLLDGS